MFNTDLSAILPMVCVTLAALASMGMEAFRRPGEKIPIGWLGIVGLTGAAVSTAMLWNRNSDGFGVIVADNFGLFVTMTLVIVGVLTIMFSSQVVHRDAYPKGEYYALLLFSIVGMMMMATANDLLVVFVALEILSLAVYVLTGIRRDSLRGTEAAFKYFMLGAFSSAFFLYGIAFTYGITGSTRLTAIGSYLSAQALSSNPMVLIALGLLLVGFAFKVSAVPFHMWTPDAYEGAPPPVTGFMSTGVKAAAFAAFARVFLTSFESMHPDWSPVLWVVAAATMIIGTVVGVAQTSVKRMLAYSSIGHGGYLLLALVSANQTAKTAILFYLLTYAVTNLGAFGIIGLLESADRPRDQVRDYAGLWNERPGLAALMTIFLLSLGGFPPFGGFIAKWYVFTAAMEAGYSWLAIIGVLTSVVSVFFYLRVVVMMYMTPAAAPMQLPAVPRLAGAALIVSAVIVFYLGVLPTQVMN